MADQYTTTILARTQGLIDRGNNVIVRSKAHSMNLLELSGEIRAFRAQCLAFLAGFLSKHPYAEQIQNALRTYDTDSATYIIEVVLPILAALKSDIQAGGLITLQERIHGDVFSNFLDMAEYLMSEDFKDPAAMLVGGVLEQHLRQLCTKHQIPVEVDTGNGLKSKTAGRMNNDLRNQQAYSDLDHNQATVWIQLRNNAAHGQYGKYTFDQVSLMLQGVRGFVARYPA